MEQMLDFLRELEQHNDREWFHANKPQYQEAVRSFEKLVGELELELKKFDAALPFTEPKDLTFKLMRDTRFSHDKSPYMPAFRAHIAQKGKLPVPVGYYLMLRPGGRSFLGGGLFADMFAQATGMVRDAIAADGAEWESILSAPDFAKYFKVQGTALKKVPGGYDAGHPQAEYLKYKSWFLEFTLTDDQLLQENFTQFAAGIFQRMQPFNEFLNRALKDFQMPAR